MNNLIDDMNEQVFRYQSKIAFQVDNAMAEFIKQEILDGGFFPQDFVYKFNIQKIADAISKQIPKKPIDQYPIDWGIGNYGACQCGEGVNYQMTFCPYCGQALDWSDVDE